MLTQPLTAILLLTTMASAVVAVVFALKWKKYKLEAAEALAQQEASTQHTINELESAKIHGCIDRTRRRQVEAVFEVLKDAVIVIDAHGEVLHTNDIASALLTCSPKQAAGQPIDEVISDHQLLATIKDARTGLPREGRMYEQEITVGDSTTAFEV